MITSDGEVSGRKFINRGEPEGSSGGNYDTSYQRERIHPTHGQTSSKESNETIPCDPCRSEKSTILADRYCNNCNEYLCKTCVRFHRKFSATASHSLQSVTNISNAIDIGEYSQDRRQQDVKELGLSDMVPIYYDEINVKTSSDRYNCNITGCELLSSGRLVLCDNENNSLKIIELKSRLIISYNFDSSPWDVTMTKDQEVVVSLPHEKKIVLFTLNSADVARARKRSLKVNGTCMGLEYFNDHLIVSYPCKLEIISLSGSVEVKRILKIKSSAKPDQFDPGPWYLAISQIHRLVFVSCRNSGEILKLPINQELSCSRMTDEVFTYPAGLCVVNNSELLICDWDSHKIELIGLARGVGQTFILDENDRLRHPQAVCYCAKQRKLFVSSYWFGGEPKCLNNIKIFQFSPKVVKSSTEC